MEHVGERMMGHFQDHVQQYLPFTLPARLDVLATRLAKEICERIMSESNQSKNLVHLSFTIV